MSSSPLSSERNRTRPSSGSVWPVRTFSNVVLPAPLGPMRPTIAPAGTSKETPSTARTPPKWRRTSRSVSRGADTERATGHDALGAEHGDENEHDPVQHLAVVLGTADDLGQHGQQHRAHERAGDGRGAT